MYQAVPDGFRGNVKALVNAVLRPAGLELGTTLVKRIEDARLSKLKDRQHWEQPHYTQALALDSDAALTFLQQTCLPFQTDYQRLPLNPNGDENQYFLRNGWFESVDAEVLYSVVRRFKPSNIVEVGSGFSTRLMRRAINDGHLATKITSIDPHPNSDVRPFADEYLESLAEDVNSAMIVDRLSAGDILFIDSSHMVKTGGDVPYLFLEILPRLKPGVLIHVHDIFLPFDYPEQWARDGWGWNEQYLVHAFLAYNNAFEILWPAHHMWTRRQSEIMTVIPAAPATARPTSLWLKKLA
jgi:hypothetical protein